MAFSDESSFECRTASSRKQWQIPGQPAPLSPRVRHPQKVMIWGMIASDHGGGRLHVCEGTMNGDRYKEVIRTRVIPQMEEWYPGGDGTFMQDKAPCHMARQCMGLLRSSNFRILDWPGNSPDLNPIENVWGILKQRIRKQSINTKQEMISLIINLWYRDVEIQQCIRRSVESMPKRIRSVIQSRGGITKY